MGGKNAVGRLRVKNGETGFTPHEMEEEGVKHLPECPL